MSFLLPFHSAPMPLQQTRDDQKLRFYSLNFPDSGIIECELNNLEYNDATQLGELPQRDD